MNWHRLFGLLLTDYFTGLPFIVELEKDLSLKKQLLDVVIVRTGGLAPIALPLPDGLEDLAAHNLITFKSHHEALDDWALKELTGHYVNYRKQVTQADEPMLPETDFRLYAVCSRYPQNLASEAGLDELKAGVYKCRRGSDSIRIIVAGQLPRTEPNALLQLFSASPVAVSFGAAHYRQRSSESSTLLSQLVSRYRQEDTGMSYTMADFRRDYITEHFAKLTEAEQRSLFQSLPLEVRLKDLSLEERLQDLSAEELEAYLQKLRAKPRAPRRNPRRKRPSS
jgi:hypothetical protein